MPAGGLRPEQPGQRIRCEFSGSGGDPPEESRWLQIRGAVGCRPSPNVGRVAKSRTIAGALVASSSAPTIPVPEFIFGLREHGRRFQRAHRYGQHRREHADAAERYIRSVVRSHRRLVGKADGMRRGNDTGIRENETERAATLVVVAERQNGRRQMRNTTDVESTLVSVPFAERNLVDVKAVVRRKSTR